MEPNAIQLSVIVPIYKVEAYLARCVESILAQDLTEMEVLLVDDGSPDRCGEMCDAYAAKDPRIRVFHKPNGGLSDARNYGLERARGEYVLFLDSDDYLTPHICNYLLATVQRREVDLVIGPLIPLKLSRSMERFEKIAADTFVYHRVYTGAEYLTGCLEGGALRVEVCRALYRREFLLRNDLWFQKGILHEDEEFTPRVLLRAESVLLTDQAFYYYDNTREDSIMNNPAIHFRKLSDRISIYNAQRQLYRTVQPHRLRRLLEDDLSWKYIDCYCKCPPERRKELTFSRFVPLHCACCFKRRLKALAFAVSPDFYAKRRS